MDRSIPVPPEMTPPPEPCEFFHDDHEIVYDHTLLPSASLPDGKPATPESLPIQMMSRRPSLATTTTSSTKATTQSSRVGSRRGSQVFNSLQMRVSGTNKDMVFSPRCLEEIHTERGYLVDALHRQSQVAENLIQDYSYGTRNLQALEEENVQGKVRRRLKKQLNMLKIKIYKAGHQQRAIACRLAEVDVELRSRQVWDRESQRSFLPTLDTSNLGGWSDDGHIMPSTPSFTYLLTPDTPINSSLNPFSPTFNPGFSCFPWSLPEEGETSMDERIWNKEETLPKSNAADRPTQFTFCSQEQGKVDDLEDVELDVGSPCSSKSLRRRLSLPNMASSWDV